MPSYTYSIAGLIFRLNLPHEIQQTRGFTSFIAESSRPNFDITFAETDILPIYDFTPLYRNPGMAVYRNGDELIRIYHEHKENDAPYAMASLSSDGATENVAYLRKYEYAFTQTQNVFSHIGFEKLLMNRRRMILHASLIDSPYGGLLFSGPSGIGKSTQAALWQQYCGAEIINGDRPILSRIDNVWQAHGSPYAGSSGYYVPKSVPITAIVLLEQGSENVIQRLPVKQAFIRLFSAATVNTWDQLFVERCTDMVSALALELPCYLMRCTPDQKAVEALKNVIETR